MQTQAYEARLSEIPLSEALPPSAFDIKEIAQVGVIPTHTLMVLWSL